MQTLKLLNAIRKDPGYSCLTTEIKDNIAAAIKWSETATDPMPDTKPVKVKADINDKYHVAALALLTGEGLNMSSFMRALGLNPRDNKERNEVKPEYERVLSKLENDPDASIGEIYRQGKDLFLKKE